MKILIVEDEKQLSESIAEYLQKQYQIETAATFEEARNKISNFEYDCILLDITLPGGNGLSILKMLKDDQKNDGVIIISAKNSLDDKIAGLELGADDYLAKPFHLPELAARISSVIRRRRFDGHNLQYINDLTIDTDAKAVSHNGKNIDLTRKEFDLLIYLVANKNKVISKDAIAEHISGEQADYMDNFDIIYAHIKNLKKKLSASGAQDYLKSVYGMGYKYEAH